MGLAAIGLQGWQIDVPVTILVGGRGKTTGSELKGNLFSGISSAPHLERGLALENHVIPENTRQRDISMARQGQDGKEGG